jgi:HEXXH motif-containing protein
VCSGPVTGDTMRLLESAQLSHRLLGLRALLDQLHTNPAAVAGHVEPEVAWEVLAEAEALDPAAVADILLHPTVGVWLTRALHHTRPGGPGGDAPWPELGHLHAIGADAALWTGLPRNFRVSVWHGVVSLPTVGHVTLPGTFPVGTADVVSAGIDSRVRVPGGTIPLDGSDHAFTPARRYTSTSDGLTLHTWLDHHDPYHGFGNPVPPTELTDVELAEWRKLVDEAWHVLTRDHRPYAAEIATSLRLLVPIEPENEAVGASSPYAFGGIRLSATESATEFAEALVHEMQHSKLNAVLDLVRLTDGDSEQCHLAPWRDDPRPLVGLLHGVYAFTCGVEFWLAEAAHGHDDVQFDIAHRRTQVRAALTTLDSDPHLTNAGRALVETVSTRLARCEEVPVAPQLSTVVTTMVADHRALWRLRHARPETATVDALTTAWCTDSAPPTWPDRTRIVPDDTRRLPANRRNLLRTKATDPALFTSLTRGRSPLPGPTPYADAALCTGGAADAAAAYHRHLVTAPDDVQAWAGLGLALAAQGRDARPLLDHPEVTLAVHRGIRARTGRAPDPLALVAWLAPATAASCRCRRSP